MDTQAFIQRLTDSETALYRVSCAILREEADRRDAMQETALKAYLKRHTLRDPALFNTWITRILINECRNVLRRQPPTLPMGELCDIAEPPQTGLRLAMDSLPEKLRLPLLLHYLEGYRLTEIGHMLRIPLGTVKYRLHTGRKAIKALWQEEEVGDL